MDNMSFHPSGHPGVWKCLRCLPRALARTTPTNPAQGKWSRTMAEQSKFAAKGPTESLPATVAPGTGRPATGKRSNPEWGRYTVLLRKATHKAAARRLQDLETGQDLSELVDELLTNWLEQR